MLVKVKRGALYFLAVVDEKNYKPVSCPRTGLLGCSSLEFRSTWQINLKFPGDTGWQRRGMYTGVES